ncbi:MAG TPA: zinc ribbon domain-containing protein, partial [Bdellovibrionota bacterium]|nr:zinc ribbon domain-containing protein [Bdellovibrionota bacterium]
MKPHQVRKHLFPFLGLAKCANCGCSITAQRQKGHSYYHCTKKRGHCGEPYVREEELSRQISDAIESVALPTESFEKMIAEWAKEREASRHQMVDLKQKAADELANTQGKLDRLLDAHLNGVVNTSEYLAKKEFLLNRKFEIDGKLTQLNRSTISWLEPLKEFLEAAHQAGQSATRENLEAQKDFFRRIGLNPVLKSRKLSYSYHLPWSILAD